MKHTRSARKALIAFTGTALALMLTFSFLPLLRANAKDYTAVKSADPDEEIQVTLTPDKVTCTMGETTQVNIDLFNYPTGLDLAFTNAKEPKILVDSDEEEWKSPTKDSEGNWLVDGKKMPARLMKTNLRDDYLWVSTNPNFYRPFLKIIPQTPGTFTVKVTFNLQDRSPLVYGGDDGGDYYDVDYELQITVKPAPTELTLAPTPLSLQVGEIGMIAATVTPEDADQTVTWSSDNTVVATVDNTGKVTGVAEGEATITAKCAADNTVTAFCPVTVMAADPQGDDPTGDDPTSSDPDDSEATYTLTGDKTWTKASKENMIFTVTKKPDPEHKVFEEFLCLEMDDKGKIETKHYEATFGSIVITLKADYLKTLSNGKHTLKVVLTDRTLTAEFTVSDDSNTDGSNTDSPATDSPATGEAVTWVVICAVLLVLSCGGISFVFVRRRVND